MQRFGWNRKTEIDHQTSQNDIFWSLFLSRLLPYFLVLMFYEIFITVFIVLSLFSTINCLYLFARIKTIKRLRENWVVWLCVCWGCLYVKGVLDKIIFDFEHLGTLEHLERVPSSFNNQVWSKKLGNFCKLFKVLVFKMWKMSNI